MDKNKVHIKRVSIRKIGKIIDRCQPYGRFMAKTGSRWVAVDNSTGDAWTEDFSRKRDAVRWLQGEFEVGGLDESSEPKEVNKMKVLVVEPLKRPQVQEFSGSLNSMQDIVGGRVHATHPFEDSVNVITMDMGKLIEQPMNRVLRDKDGKIDDVICGAFIICGVSDEDFISLTDEQIARYTQLFYVPEVFLHIGGRIMVLKVSDYEGLRSHATYDPHNSEISLDDDDDNYEVKP